jgi:hypothetical protein
MSIYPATPISH